MDHTNATTHPITLQPRKKFSRKIASRSRLLRASAMIEGRKYITNPKPKNGKNNSPRRCMEKTSYHKVTIVDTQQRVKEFHQIWWCVQTLISNGSMVFCTPRPIRSTDRSGMLGWLFLDHACAPGHPPLAPAPTVLQEHGDGRIPSALGAIARAQGLLRDGETARRVSQCSPDFQPCPLAHHANSGLRSRNRPRPVSGGRGQAGPRLNDR